MIFFLLIFSGIPMAGESNIGVRKVPGLALLFPLALMLSPDSLALLGNKVGSTGIHFLLVLAFGAFAHTLTAFSYGRIYQLEPGARGEVVFVNKSLGSFIAFLFPACSRALFTICAATGILATAGYVFNEIFVIWFPNLGFSFLVLGILLLINLAGRKAIISAQILSMGMVISGLILLSLWGIFSAVPDLEAGHASGQMSFSFLQTCGVGLILLMGFELAAATGYPKMIFFNRTGGLLAATIAGGVILLALWGTASLLHVSPERLMATSVPYSTAAREILGGVGRKIMGLTIIAAAFGFANALLSTVPGILTTAAEMKVSGACEGTFGKYNLVPLSLLFLAILIMLASGMAGEPHLEIYTRGSIYLWLLNYSTIHLSLLVRSIRGRLKPDIRDLFIATAGLLLTSGSVIALMLLDTDSLRVFKFMIVFPGIIIVLSLSGKVIRKCFSTFNAGG
jgi:hypothetical protein